VASVVAALREGGDVNLRRVLRHLLMTRWRERRAFAPAALEAIREAITGSERRHSGQIRFAVEGALHGMRLLRGQSPRQRALELFASLHLWDTHERNGVLIYLLLADRAVEIVVDRGAHQRAETAHWHRVCRQMEAKLRDGLYLEGVIGGIEAVTEVMAAHFPPTGKPDRNLPDEPLVI
jgi:TPM domain